MPLTLTLISAAFPSHKRGMAIGLWGGICGLAVAAGPVVGGAVAGGISWHWIFWLNIPVGAALIPLAVSKLTESYGPRPRLDLIGLALAGAGLLGVAFDLVHGNDAGWSSTQIITALACGAALVVVFAGWEAHSHPMLPLGLFRSRGFDSANGVSFFMYAGLFGTLFLMAQFLQNALGDSPLHAGIVMLPWTAAPRWESTDWQQIISLYDTLTQIWPSPVVALNRAIAIGEARGPHAGLATLDQLAAEPQLAGYHYLPAARADFLRRLHRADDARLAYHEALLLADNPIERDFLTRRLGELDT